MMQRKIIVLLILLLYVSIRAYPQLGGKSVYSFLNLSYSARTAAFGMNMIPVFDKDVSLAVTNPSLLNENMANYFHLTFTNYLSDIGFGTAAYGRKFKNDFMGLASIRYINYGDFIRADELGNKLGEFTAAEYAISTSCSKKLYDRLYAGASLNLIYSSFDNYSSSGLGLDMGITWNNPDKLMTASLLMSNLGFQIKPYSVGNREPLPLNVQLGFSKKPEHMPLRIIIVAHHLNQLNFAYLDPNKQQFSSFDGTSEVVKTVPLSEKIFRHFNVGGELVLSENFNIRFGYNHQRRKELQIPNRPAMAGFSWGFGLRLSKFHISYANTIYHVVGGSNTFSVSMNLADMIKKRDKDSK